MYRLLLAAIVMAPVACKKGPPPDFVPDPGLVSRIREIRITLPTPTACPGETFQTAYEAVLDDGSRLPFATRYDRDRPPALHVTFLERTSAEARPHGDGSWVADDDPMVSLLDGFTITATLRANPALRASARVTPEYSCLSREYSFRGHSGGNNGGPGGDGPDITVRLGIVRSPFVDRLLIAAIEVGEAPPVYHLADASRITPRDWLEVESRGGRGGRGREGQDGVKGSDGTQGCPGTNGGPGGAGSSGGRGGVGGRGGHITIIAAAEEPFLAGLVDVRSRGGDGGDGGPGGQGGEGGQGGAPIRPECGAGTTGTKGPDGSRGSPGTPGRAGPRPQVLTVPLRDVFGQHVPRPLATLLDAGPGR
jgi:hypothetical protein